MWRREDSVLVGNNLRAKEDKDVNEEESLICAIVRNTYITAKRNEDDFIVLYYIRQNL